LKCATPVKSGEKYAINEIGVSKEIGTCSSGDSSRRPNVNLRDRPLALFTIADGFKLPEYGNMNELLYIFLPAIWDEALWNREFSINHDLKLIETLFHLFRALDMSLEVLGMPKAPCETQHRTRASISSHPETS
jgi:hypothetical protein